MNPRRILALTVAVAAFPTATAHADQPLDPATGGVNLSAGGGYAVWAEPAEDTGWQLVVRSPDGAVSRPRVPGFAGPPDVSVGTGGGDPRPLMAVYSRSTGSNEDLFALDLLTGREHRVVAVSTARADEAHPSLQYGRLAFVRRGGAKPGVYVWNGRGAARRVTSTAATQTAVSESRVAYATATRVTVRPLSGRGATSTFRTTARPRSLVLSRYRVGWLQGEGRVMQSDRVTGGGTDVVRTANRALPPATQSIALESESIGLRLGADGLQRLDPELAFR